MSRAVLLLAPVLAVALAACGGGPRRLSSSASQTSEHQREPDEASEMAARLAGATFGRVPGQPVSCVDVSQISSNRALGRSLLLFEGVDGRQYANRVQNCPILRYGHSVRLKTVTARLCSGNEVEVLDPRGTAIPGNCSVGDFLTYVPRAQ